MKIGKKTLISTILAATILSGCSDLPENYLGVKKDTKGKITFHEGPKYENLGIGTVNLEWNGRRVIDLPLEKGSDQSQHYKTDDGVVNMDLTINYCLGKTQKDRTKWFVTQTNAEEQYPAAIEGIARATVNEYTTAETLNEEIAKEHGRLPIHSQVHLNLYNSPINDKFGVDKGCYAVWPGNTSLLAQEVQGDLNRQRRNIIKTANAKAQGYYERAGSLKAIVDGEYARTITKLNPELQNYLKNLGMAESIKTVAKEEGQEVDIQLFVE